MRRSRPIRPKRPYIATPDQVRITREDDPVAIYIDDEEYSLREFGEILQVHAGWGMRITFVPEDRVHEEPAIEVRKPEKGG